jgi:RHS repeat-associated protein
VYYVYNGMTVIQERDVNNNPLVTYTRGTDLSGTTQGAGGIGGLLARTDTNGSSFYHTDGNGNVTMLVSGTGTMMAKYLYDSYGNTLGTWGTLAAANTYRYSSKEVDLNSGLYYFGERYYQPNLQRWLNRDPIEEAGGINLYGFVGNDSINWFDPLGLREDVPPGEDAPYTPLQEQNLANLANEIRNQQTGSDPYYLQDPDTEGFLDFLDNGGADAAMMMFPGPDELAAANTLDKLAKPTLAACKKALKKVHDIVGKLPKGKPGKWGSPQAGDKYRGYRMDPPHPPSDIHPPGSDGTKPHIDWWNWPSGKRGGTGSTGGKVPIE